MADIRADEDRAKICHGIAFGRTPQQVLRIVYLTSKDGVTGGGFYPKGMKGAPTDDLIEFIIAPFEVRLLFSGPQVSANTV